MTREEAKLLFDKYRRGLCTREELALLESWYIRYAHENHENRDSHDSHDHHEKQGKKPDEAQMNRDLAEIWENLKVHADFVQEPKYRFKRFVRQVAAAVLILVGVAAALLAYRGFFEGPSFSPEAEVAHGLTPLDIDSSQDGYILLEDGRVIPLSGHLSGTLFEENDTRIQKVDGRIVYEAEVGGLTSQGVEPPVFSTIVVPKGRQYELVLSDGTQVWLNSFSSIRFPDKFDADSREVAITGEAYFEVAKDPDRTFLVTSREQVIRVLGTNFNVNSYEDEDEIRTTVLEGSVEVSIMPADPGSTGSAFSPESTSANNASFKRVLQPGLQSRYSASGRDFDVVAVDLEEVVAWKDGLILFEDTALEKILRQVARWYDIEVEYRGAPPERHFTGGVSRQAPLSEFLKVLEINEVPFQMKGRKLMILNK